jgi:hypothetical protein
MKYNIVILSKHGEKCYLDKQYALETTFQSYFKYFLII